MAVSKLDMYGGPRMVIFPADYSGKAPGEIAVPGASGLTIGLSIGIHGFLLVFGRVLTEWW